MAASEPACVALDIPDLVDWMLATGCRIGEALALRHTLATQAINRGMRLEAIAALLGHRSMEMTLVYARIANRVVADEHQAVSAKIDTLYGAGPARTASRLRNDRHGQTSPSNWLPRPDRIAQDHQWRDRQRKDHRQGIGEGQFVLGATG